MTESAKEWFARFPALGEDALFTVRFRIAGKAVAITAWQGPNQAPNHTRLFCQLRTEGKVLFPRENWYVGVPGHKTIDGKYAKELAVSLFDSILPDSDDDEYTADQRAWIESHGEELMMAKIQRFGEEPS